MRIAIISTKPASLNSGGEVRIYYLREGLKKNFSVDFFMPQITTSFDFLTRLKNLLSGKIPYFEYVKTATLTDEQIEQIKNADIIQVEELESFYAIEKYLKDLNKPIVLDAHNIEYKKFLADTSAKNFIEKSLGQILAQKVMKLEIEALKKINYILTCSEVEKKYFSLYKSAHNICCIPNGVKKNQLKATLNKSKNILFMGLLSYGPNADGIRYYLEEIHPLVKKMDKEITVTIIGRNPSDWLQEKAKNDNTILVKGFVDSVDVELQKATVCICPIRYGSGTRLKVLEYMAAGKPVISTAIGAEGITAKVDKEIIIADEPNIFAEKILELINNKEKATQIGLSAKTFTEKNYNWDFITKKLSKFYTEKLKDS